MNKKYNFISFSYFYVFNVKTITRINFKFGFSQLQYDCSQQHLYCLEY